MSQPVADVSQETLAATKAALSDPQANAVIDDVIKKDATTQGISTTLGIVGVNLEAPSKKLFPVLSPLRNRIPRKNAAVGSTAVSWKAITAINAAGLSAGVAEGERNSFLSTTEVDKSATYKSIGFDDFTTFEAMQASRGFEDARAMSVANTLSALMIAEEVMLLGGNASDIGAPTNLAAVDTANAGPLTASTAYDIKVSALTLAGYRASADGNGGSDSDGESAGSTKLDHTTGAGKTAITLSWDAVRGAVAYNVYIDVDAGTPFYCFTTTKTSIEITTAVLAALPGAGNVPNTADQTGAAYEFDGIIPQISASGSGSYWLDLDGAALTTDNAGGIPEWDAALKSIYDASRVGPSLIMVSTQEAENAIKKIAANGSSTVFSLNAAIGPNGEVSGGLQLTSYLNRYTQQKVPIMTHPFLPAGTTLMVSERLPFPSNQVPNVFEVDVRQPYTQYEWALVKRRYEYGVYASEVLKVYFPAGCAVLTGIADG